MGLPVKRFQRQLLAIQGFALLPLALLIYFALQDSHPSHGSVGSSNEIAIIVVGVFVFAMGFVSVYLIARKLRTLGQFEDATRRLTNGDYSRRVDVDVNDEFLALGRAFNELTDQLEESLASSRSLADIDRLILNSANLDTILFKVLASAQMEALEVTLLLRQDMSSSQVSTYRLERQRMVEDFVSLSEVTDDSLKDIEGYRTIADKVCGNNILECLEVAEEGSVTGVLVAVGPRSLRASESKRLTDLVDRLSVAVTNIRRSESLFQQAHFDALTGLINRHAFEDKLRECVSRARRGETGVLLFMDLDGFKKVNDTEGHEAGDRLLVAVSERLREVLRPEDTIARLGGDEFAIIAPGCGDGNSVSQLCERIIEAVTRPVVVERMEHSIGASIGVVMYPGDGMQTDELVMKADSAMYRAKESGGSRFAFFDDTLNEANRHRVLVESRLRGAIKQGGLEVHFQPKLNVKTWSVDSAEALMRWRDEELGEVRPDMFVSIAEETSLIHDFMPILVDQAASLLAAASKAGTVLDSIAVNASPKQLMADGFALSLLSLLDRNGLPHDSLELEVTETVFARDTEQVVRELEILRTAGMKIALDDFGTGYSSLNMLRELPLDSLKIDRAFITELEVSKEARLLVQHLISIASTLGMQVVAEGVETDVQLQHLLDTDCDYVQGFLISRALPEADFITTLLGWQSDAGARTDTSIDLSVSQSR
jgi:diguanylate cyclase (GGDEF)-like protein